MFQDLLFKTDKILSMFCKSHIVFQESLNRVKDLTKYARKGQTKYLQLVVVAVVVVVEE